MIRALAAALAASAALVVAYVALGGGDFAPSRPPDPCRGQVQSADAGLTGAVERIGLTALNTTACNLGVSRERLLLSLAGETELGVDDARRGDAFRAGLRTAIDEEERAGRLSAQQAFLLRQAVSFLPVEALIDRLFRSG